MANKLIWNHVQLENLKNVLWFIFNNCFTKTCLKIQSEHNFKNTIPNEVRPLAMESPWKFLSVAFNLASKFLLFLKWHEKW